MSTYSGLKGGGISGSIGAAATIYANVADLPSSGVSTGSQAFVTANNTLYIWQVNGWSSIALVDTSVVAGPIDLLVVAGGGGGGGGGAGGSPGAGGGGGAGEYKESIITAVTGNVYTINVGGGGIAGPGDGHGGVGEHSSIVSAEQGISIISWGGAGGPPQGSNALTPAEYGSGAGSARGTVITPAVGNGGFVTVGSRPTLLNKGAGGGGGAGAAASNSAANNTQAGGAGKQWIDGNYYAGGGGGAKTDSGYSPGGIGGGGDGFRGEGAADAGDPNTGGGGGGQRGAGGAGQPAYPGGAGGSGVVIIRDFTARGTGNTTGTCEVSTSGDYTYYKFTSSGTISWGG